MARKRMFDIEIIDTDLFLEMPISTRLLYYDLSMRADDDGFISNYKKILRMTGTSEDDLKILLAKQYILPFDTGVIVIKHWKINNYLRKDRYTQTLYKEEKKQLEEDENGAYLLSRYTTGIPVVDTVKSSKEENSKEESSSSSNTTTKKENIFEFLEKNFGRTIAPIEYEKIIEWEKHFSKDIIKHAISESCLNNAKTMNYLTTILQDWKSKGFTKLSEIEDRNKNKKEEPKKERVYL